MVYLHLLKKNDPFNAPPLVYSQIKHRPDILLIHDTPKHSLDVIGKEEIWNVVKKINPKVCIYGHCHHREPHYKVDGINLFNVDSRIIIFE